MIAPDDRWYKGQRHCVIVSAMSPMHTVKVQWDDGTFDIAPIRLCWRWRNPNQDLPPFVYFDEQDSVAKQNIQQDMLKANFKKVCVSAEDKDGTRK